jgi:NADH dehydrogenase [ubiquinone] 1 alpha subcomplex assembly factor 7
VGVAHTSRGSIVSARLGDRIARRIRSEGPLTLAAYIAMALYDPLDGYYARRDPIGAEGDFTTAPEISQIFGELIGLWCAALWLEIGQPDPVIVAELGPGRGILMSDFLRAAETVPGFRRALRVYLVEVSPVLQVDQENRLRQAQPVWVGRSEDLPDGPILIIANEFLDTSPVRQFVRGASHWSERMVALDPEGRLVFVDGPESPVATLHVPEALRQRPPGTVVEICPAALALAAKLGARFAHQRGAALLVDYGYFPSAPGPTVRALRGHRSVSALSEPGTADISAHVDFAAFAETAQQGGAEIHGPVLQREFLAELGAELRLAALKARSTPHQQRDLEAGVRRLLDPSGMGLFKVMAVVSPGLPTPAGFAASLK